MANSQQNPFLDLTTQIDIEGLVGSLKDQAAQTAVNAAFQKLFRDGATAGSKEAVDEFIKSLQDLTAKPPKELFKDTVGNIGEARKGLDQLIAAAKNLKLVDPGNEFAKSLLEKITAGINSSIRKINELNSTKVNIQVDPASFKSFDDLARRLELALADVARLNEELAQGVAQGNLKVSPEVQNSVENTANQVANLGKQVEFLSKEVLAFVSVLQVKIGETSGATSFVGKILGIDSETILKQLGDFTKELEDLGRRSSQSFAKGFAEGGKDSARDAVRSIVSDLATQLTKIKDFSTIKFEGASQFDKITQAADALLDVFDKLIGKQYELDDVFNKSKTGNATKYTPKSPIALGDTVFGTDRRLGEQKAAAILEELNRDFFTQITSKALDSASKFRNAFTEANNALEIDFRSTFETITEILEKFVVTAQGLVPKIFKFGQGGESSEAQGIAKNLESVQASIAKAEEERAATSIKADKEVYAQRIAQLKLYQEALLSAQAKGGFSIGGTATSDHLSAEAKQLQEIVDLIVRIGQESKIAGVLILLKGPKEHFIEEIRLLNAIAESIIEVGQAAKVASISVANLGNAEKLSEFKKQLGEIQAALELARESLAAPQAKLASLAPLLEEYGLLRDRLKEVDDELAVLARSSKVNNAALDVTSVRAFQDEIRALARDRRAALADASDLLAKQSAQQKELNELGGSSKAKEALKEEIAFRKEEIKATFEQIKVIDQQIEKTKEAKIQAVRLGQDNRSNLFKPLSQELEAEALQLRDRILEIKKTVNIGAADELESLIQSIQRKISALEIQEAQLKSAIGKFSTEKPQIEDNSSKQKEAAAEVANNVAAIEKQLKNASTAGRTLADILTEIGRGTRAGSLSSTGLAGGVLSEPTATPKITEALNKTRASQKELLALTQEGAAERLKVFEQERQAVLDLIGKATAQRVELTTKAEAQIEAAIAASGAAQEKQEELRARKALEFSNERERIAADEAAAIEKLNLKAIRAADVVAEAQAKRVKTIVLNYENAKKSLETLTSAFQGFRPFSTQGFGVGGGGGTGPVDFGNISQLAGKLPELFKSATGEINPYIAVIAKATEVTFQFIKAAKALVDNALEFAKNQRQLAQAIDLSRENIAAFTLGFQRAGQPVFSLDIALSSLQQKIEAAFAGDEKASKFLDALGTSATNAAGGMQSLDVALSQIARDAATTGETAEKAAARVAVFGIFGQRAVGQTIRTFEALRKEALETGLVLSEQAEGALFDYYTSITRIETIVQGLINTFAAGIAPAFTEFNKQVGDLIKQLDLKDPDAIKQFESALKNILGILADGLGTLAEFKNILDLISVPLNAILTLFTGEAAGATEVKLKSFIGLISRLVEVLSDLAELASNFRFGPIGALFNLVNGSVGAATGKTLVEQIFGKPEDARAAASSITNIGEAADAAGKKVENLGTLLARLKREASAKDRASEEAIAKEQASREEAVDKVRAAREEGRIGPLAAAQEIARIENESAQKIKDIRSEQYKFAKDQVKEITGIEYEETKRRLDLELTINEVKAQGAKEAALRSLRAAEEELRLKVSQRNELQRVASAEQSANPQDSVLAERNRLALADADTAIESARKQVEIEQGKYKKIADLQAKDSEDFKKHVQEKVDAAEGGGKREAQAESERIKTAAKNRTEEFRAAQEERDNLLKQGTASLREAVNREIGIIEEKAKKGIITEKEANLEKLKLEGELIDAKLRIQEGFARGANQPVKSKDTKSLAGIYDEEIKFYEKRVALQKEAIKLDDERLDGEKLLTEENRQQAAEDEQFLENLKRKRDEVVQGRIDQLKKERDAAPPESLQRARIDAEIAANQAILDGRIQTQAQITKNEEEMAQTRADKAKNEGKQKEAVIESEIAVLQKLIALRQAETKVLEARANAEQEAIKRQSGLTQEQIDAGGADYRLTQARINASIALLKAKLSILDTEITYLKTIKASAPEILNLEAQRLDLATQLNEVLRTRFELLDKAAAKEAEAFNKGAGAAGGTKSRSTDDPLFGAPQSFEEGQKGILDAIRAQREAGAEAFSGLAGLYTYYANLVGEATKAGADQINGLIDKLQGDIRGLTNPGGAQIQGLLNYFTNQAKDALQAAFKRRDELFNAEAEKAAKEAADKALAERKRVEDGVKAIAQRQADAEKAAAERLEEQLKDIRKQREDAIREDAERRIELQEALVKRQEELEKRFVEEDIARARQAARDKFDVELEFIRSLAQARFDAATQAFNAARDFAKKDYDLRQSLAKNDTSIQEAEKSYRDQLSKVQDTKTKLDQAKTAADRERLNAELRADTEALNANLKAIADLQKEREALRKDREAAAKVRDLERQRQQQLADLFRRAALGELDKEELDLLVKQLNQRFDLERDYINDRNDAAKTGDAEYLQQIEDAYNQQREAQAELHRQELAADKKFREEKKRREIEDEGLRQADRAKQRQDLINDYNDQLKDLDKALEKRLNAFRENEKKVREEYKTTLDKIKEDSTKALAELGIAYDKFFEGLVEKVKNVGTEVGKVLKSIGDMAGKVPDTKGSGAASGDGGSTTTSGPTTTSGGNPNGPSVGSGYQDPKDAPKGGSTSVGPANPYTGTPSGPSSTSGYQDPNKAPNGGPSTVGPAGGGGGGSSTTSSAGLGLRNKGQGGGNDLSGTADNGNRITFAGLSSEVLTNDIINKATGLKRGERATPKSAIDVLNFALNPYHYDKDGKKVYEPAYISQADYARAVRRIKDFYQPANIEALYKRRVITASYAVGMVEDAFAAGFYGKQKADPEYTRLLKAAFFEGKGDNTYAKYGDIIKALEDGKITPAQAWDQAARRSRLIGGDLDARRVAVYLKEFWGYDANPGDASRPQGYDPAKDTGPALTTEGGGGPGLGSDTPSSSIGDLNNIISGGALLAGADSIAGKGDLSSVGEIQGAAPTYDTASVVDIGPVNLTRRKPGKIKPGPPILPVGGFGGGGGTPNTGTKAITGIDTTAPGGPKTTPYQSGGGGGTVTGPTVTAYNEIEGVKKLKAEFRRIFDYVTAGTHTNQEIQSEINISAGLVTNLGNKGLFKEAGGIEYETYKRAMADLLALAQLTPQGLATFTNSPFFEGKYVPPPGNTNPSLSYSPTPPPTLLSSTPSLSSFGGVSDISFLDAATTPSLPTYNIQTSSGSPFSSGTPTSSDITGGFRDAAPAVRNAASTVTNAIRTLVRDAVAFASKELANQIVSDISVGRWAK